MYFESHLFCAVLEFAQHLLELLFCGRKQEDIVSKAHIREAIVVVVSQANTHSPFLLPAWKVVFQRHLQMLFLMADKLRFRVQDRVGPVSWRLLGHGRDC